LNNRRPSVLLVAAKWWPLSARLAIALVRHRCRVRVLCPAGHMLTHVSGLDRVDRYGGLDSLACLRRSLREFNPDIVVPCDDGVVAQLHALHAQQPSMRETIERSLGAPQNYSIVSSRYKLLSTAMDLGICVPKTGVVTGSEDLAGWHANGASASVLKVDGESGGNGVRITRSLRDSVAAWRQLGARRSIGAACKRMAIDRYPLALWMRKSQSDREIIIQAFVRGRPANSMFACRQGKVLSMVSVAVVVSDGPIGAATIIRRISNESMSRAAELLAARDRQASATGAKDDLIYVSPRSGRAVSRAGGEAYRDKLMRLPEFLRTDSEPASAADLADAFALTGFFLDRYAFAPRGLPLPDARARFVAAVLVQAG